MKTPSRKGLAILAGGLAFVGSTQAVDLIVNGSFEDLGGLPSTPAGWNGVAQGYNYSAAYFTGPAIPASENPGSVYSWRHSGSLADEAYATPLTQSVDLLAGASAADIDAGRGQYTFSAWMASYGTPGNNPEQPYLTVKFLDQSSTQVGSTVVLDRVTPNFFVTFADGVTTFDSSTHLHDWAKYVRTSNIPIGARTAIVGIQHSPNSGLSGRPDTYTDLVKLDVSVTDTRPSLDTAIPSGSGIAANATVRVTLQDGSLAVNQNTISMVFDGSAVVPDVTKNGAITTIQYNPGLMAAGSSHSYTVVFADNAVPPLFQTNSFSFTVGNYATVPTAYAKPTGSATTPGFVHRTVQAPVGTLPNTLARARAQLDGTLIDPNTGQPYGNVAALGPNPDGSYNVDTVLNFEQSGTAAGNFPGDLPFPGLAAQDQNAFSTESLFQLELPAGYYRFVVNSDDGFEVSVGADPVDAVAPRTVLGLFDGGRGAGDTPFDFLVQTSGIYTFRLIFEEGDGGASCEFFSVDPATGARTLINDVATAGSIKSFRVLTGVVQPAYVRSTTPGTGAIDVPIETAIQAQIWDRDSAVTDGSIVLSVNGSPVNANVSRNGTITSISYQPENAFGYGATVNVQLSYTSGGTPIVKSWSFVTRGAVQPPGITGQWDFENGDLAATIGRALEFFGGATGDTASQTQFGTTTSFGIPDIKGFPAKVMKSPGVPSTTFGYVMRHGAVPNGSPTASKVNQWTLIMDLFIPVQNARWLSFVQIDTPANTSDGDLFADFGGGGGNFGGMGISGNYSANTNITKGTWHRIAFAVDSATVISKFVDGVKSGDQSSWSGLGLDGRHAMLDRAVLFADDDAETMPVYVNSVQFRNYKMRDSELAALGGPDPGGIPTVGGQWDFENQNSFSEGLLATVGTDMSYLPDTEFSTTFVPAPFGTGEANVMFYSAALTDGYIIVPGGIANGGGDRINQYTLIMDLQFPASSASSWHSLWQTRTNNQDDASLFIRPGGGIGISGTYHGALLPDTWYRLAFTFDLVTRTLKKYTNGVLAGEQTLSEGVDGRWSVGPTALLFADNDGDNSPGLCNSVQFHPRVLSPSEIADLGRPGIAGIPVAIPQPLRITQVLPTVFDLEIHWAGGAGPYQVQFRERLDQGSWQDYGGPTADTSATVDRNSPTGYYRVIGQ